MESGLLVNIKIIFSELKKGDRFVLETLLGRRYEIIVKGERKLGLQVKVKEFYNEEIQEYTAIMTGEALRIIGKQIPHIQVESKKNLDYLFWCKRKQKQIKTA